MEFGIVTEESSEASWKRQGMQFGKVTLTGVGVNGLEISNRTHERDLRSRLGAPIESAPVVREMVHTFRLGQTMLDTFHDPETGYVREVTMHRRGER